MKRFLILSLAAVASNAQFYSFDTSTVPTNAIGVCLAYNDVAVKQANGCVAYAHKLGAGTMAYTRMDLVAGKIVTGLGASQYMGSLFNKKVSLYANITDGPQFTTGAKLPAVATSNISNSLQTGGDVFFGKKNFSVGLGGARFFDSSGGGIMARVSFFWKNVRFQ